MTIHFDTLPKTFQPLSIGDVPRAGDLVRIGDAMLVSICKRGCMCGWCVGAVVEHHHRFWGER